MRSMNVESDSGTDTGLAALLDGGGVGLADDEADDDDEEEDAAGVPDAGLGE